jgi:hypothetical protein
LASRIARFCSSAAGQQRLTDGRADAYDASTAMVSAETRRV